GADTAMTIVNIAMRMQRMRAPGWSALDNNREWTTRDEGNTGLGKGGADGRHLCLAVLARSSPPRVDRVQSGACQGFSVAGLPFMMAPPPEALVPDRPTNTYKKCVPCCDS